MSALLETNYSYQFPPTSVVAKANDQNWVSVNPSSGSTFDSDSASQIVFKIDSTSSLMRLNSCYLKYTVTPLSGGQPAGANTSVNTTLGLASVIQSISVRIGNTELRRVDNYPALLSMLYSSFNPTRQSFLNYTEAFNDTTVLQGGSRIVTHSLQIPVFLSAMSLPLMVVANGIEVRITLTPAAQVFTAGGTPAVDRYRISNASFGWEETVPSPGYVQALLSRLERGGVLHIPTLSVYSVSQYCSGGSNNVFNLDVGNATSISSILATFVTDAAVNTQVQDKYSMFSSQGLTSYHWEVGTNRIPKNHEISYGTGANFDPESLTIQTLSTYGNVMGGQRVYYANNTFDANQFRLGITFVSSDETFSNGYSTLAGQGIIRLVTNHSGTIPSTSTRLVAWVFTDSLINISKDLITYTERF